MLFGRDLRLPCDLLFGRPPDTPSSPEKESPGNLRTEKMKVGDQFKEGSTTRLDARTFSLSYNRISLYNFKDNKRRRNPDPVLTNIPAVRYGLENEDYARHTVQQRNPHYVVRKTGLVVHPIQQYIAASPDGLIRSGEDYMIMEIKCPYNPEGHSLQELINKRHEFCLSNNNGVISLKRTQTYYYQLHCQLG
ncbi:SWIM-type domain-containing protein, partial [Trichonephila clavipes]